MWVRRPAMKEARSFFGLLQDFLELLQIFGGELFIFGEVDEERADVAAEEAFEKGLAFGADAIGFLERRRIEEKIFIFLDGEGFLFDKTVKESFDGVGVPGFLIFDGFDDVVGGLGMLFPENAHDFPFGGGDGGGVGFGGGHGVMIIVFGGETTYVDALRQGKSFV